jgi:hypothetical protein
MRPIFHVIRAVLTCAIVPLAFVAAVLLSGCYSLGPAPNDPTSALDKCDDEAHAAFDQGKSVEESMRVYNACKKREGI